jgi:hypothetical protein
MERDLVDVNCPFTAALVLLTFTFVSALVSVYATKSIQTMMFQNWKDI